MCNIGAKQRFINPDLNKKEIKEKLGIENIRPVANDGLLDEFLEYEAAGNGKDEVLFQAGPNGNLYIAEGKKIDMDAFSDLWADDDHPVTYKGDDIDIEFIDNQNFELNGRSSGKSHFEIEGIRELKVPMEEAKNLLRKDGIDQIFFRSEGKDYVAYGKKILTEEFVDVAEKSLGANDPIMFNGKEISVNFVDDEANSFLEGVNHALDKNQNLNAALALAAATAGLTTGGLVGLAVYPVVTVGAAIVVEGAIGGIKGATNKSDSKAMDNITSPDVKSAP